MAVINHPYRRKRTAVAVHRAGEWLLHLTVLSIAAAVVLANTIR